MVEAIGHADGDLDPVVGRLEPGVGGSKPDGSDDVGPSSPDFPGGFGSVSRLTRSLRKKTQLLNARPVPPISRWESIEVGA